MENFVESILVLSNIGHNGGYQWRFSGSLPWPISADIAGYSAIGGYGGAKWLLVWRDFGFPTLTTLVRIWPRQLVDLCCQSRERPIFRILLHYSIITPF
jgi:hypothetical protein